MLIGLLFTILRYAVILTGIYVSIVFAVGLYLKYIFVDKIKRQVRQVQKNGKFKNKPVPEDAFDVAIVGSGPAGSCMAHYLAIRDAKVALLDRATFPRDKICGDALCVPAMRIVKDMGVLQVLEDEKEIFYSDTGGFVTPSGISYFGASVREFGEPLAGAVKRVDLDNRLLQRAIKSGTNFMGNWEVDTATFDKETGLWSVKSAEGEKVVKARVLVCADGAQSKLATKLGLCTEPPKGICSRVYIEGHTHNCKFDGVLLLPPHSLPGYVSLFKHQKDLVSMSYYLIPHGEEGWCGATHANELPRLTEYALKEDPFTSKAVGPKAKYETMKSGPLRIGCQGIKTTFDDHLLIIGDAAGFIDPISGEGIHTALESGKLASETVLEMMHNGDFSSASCAQYEDKWINQFGYDFEMSRIGSGLMYKYPVLLDTMGCLMELRGNPMMSKFARVMTGVDKKELLFTPQMAIPMSLTFLYHLFVTKVLKQQRTYGSTFKHKVTK